MKGYSNNRMRKECQTVFRLLLAEAVLLLFFSAVTAALWKVLDHGETKSPLVGLGVMAALSLFLLGSYFMVSDTKWMLKHTLYGKTLAGLGDAETLMREIDKEAETMDYECASFALMTHWLVLYQCGFPRSSRIQSRPIPVHHIARIGWGKDAGGENGGFLVRIVTADDAEWETFVWETADINALRAWGAAQEKQEI